MRKGALNEMVIVEAEKLVDYRKRIYDEEGEDLRTNFIKYAIVRKADLSLFRQYRKATESVQYAALSWHRKNADEAMKNNPQNTLGTLCT